MTTQFIPFFNAGVTIGHIDEGKKKMRSLGAGLTIKSELTSLMRYLHVLAIALGLFLLPGLTSQAEITLAQSEIENKVGVNSIEKWKAFKRRCG